MQELTNIDEAQIQLGTLHANIKHHKSLYKKFAKATQVYSQSLHLITKKAPNKLDSHGISVGIRQLETYISEFGSLMGEMSNKVFEEHKTLKENSKKVSQLKKQLSECALLINKSWESVTKSYKSSHKDWMKFSKKLEKADIELEEQRKSPHKTSSYEELFSKYEITKQKAEIKKDVYLINETKMQKGEEKLSSSVQEFLRKIKKSSEEISSKCLNSTENLKMFSETFIAKFQKFHNVLGAQKEVNKEALVLRSGDNKQNFSKDKFIIENKEESSLRKSLFNKEPENEVPNENNSLIINKSFDYNSSKTQDKIKRIISQRSVTKDLTLDTAEDLVKYYTNEKVQEDSERLEPNTDESVCLNPIIGKTFRGSLRTAESRD